VRRVVRRLLGLDEPQETRFFLFIAAWAIGAGIVYWFVSYELAGTALLAGVGVACGLVVMRLVFVRRSADVRRRARAEAAAAASEGLAATEQGDRDDPRAMPREGQGGGTAGVDRPFVDEPDLLPEPTIAPFAVGLGVSLCALGGIFGPAPVLVGLLPLGWGAWLWLEAARGESPTTASVRSGDDAAGKPAPGSDSHGHRRSGPASGSTEAEKRRPPPVT
jgi:hypothetical protein